ncbi:hypothetical protein Godav_029146 [Gossypium davidsonii]|uniref:Uncharacterized protein n=1 Tax=Gossypium davidsonii TaxID=34287 RepID=A0A7J8T5F9_GOSDV|nr:hypothetical protein [Gossypium davidsonii]
MLQSDRVLRQFGCRQLIFVAPEVFDDHHKIDLRREAAVITCPKRTTWDFKSKTKGRRHMPINEAQTFTRPIISGHSITKPSESTNTVTRPSSSTNDTHGTAFSDDVRCLSYPFYIS